MIGSLRLVNWKGHEELHLSFKGGVNFLVGPNGSGKTSVLDAICFAILGDIKATTIYKGLTYKDLIRNPESDLDIELTFSPPGKDKYTVTRTHSASSNRKSCTLSSNGRVITRRWDEATEKILELYDSNDLFFRRVVLLSEGDTFVYSTQPPGEGLNRHIENVLGINRLELLRDNLRRLGRDYQVDARHRKEQIEGVQQTTDEDRETVEELSKQIHILQGERESVSENIDSLNNQIGVLSSKIQRTQDLISLTKSLVVEWSQTFGDPPPNYEFVGAIEALDKSLSSERASLLEQRDSLRDELAWLKGQADSEKSILELVKPLEEDYEEVACPVCKRPLTLEMVIAIKDEATEAISEIKERHREKSAKLPLVDDKMQEIDANLEELLNLESKVKHILEQEPGSLSITVLESYIAEDLEKQSSIQEKIDDLKKEVSEKNEKIKINENELSAIKLRFDEQERYEMQRSLTSSLKGQFISHLFLDSIEESQANQRRSLLRPLTKELSTMWSTFLNVDVDVEMKSDAQLIMIDKQTGASLEFPQLSGGEKTALLIFTQVLLCKYFANTDFMLLDEPLEHLDARNRFALIRYLVDTTKFGYPKQLIVTTIEESLIREYLDEAAVKISILSRKHELVEGV